MARGVEISATRAACPPRSCGGSGRPWPSASPLGAVALSCLIFLVLLTPASTSASEETEIERGLRANHAYWARGRTITRVEHALELTGNPILRAALYLELGRVDDARVARVVSDLLPGENVNVARFALHALSRLSPPESLVHGGGDGLAYALAALVESTSPNLRRKARSMLAAIVGTDLGERCETWRSWLAANPEHLESVRSGPPFDETAYDPERVEAARRALGLRTTVAGSPVPASAHPPSPVRFRPLDLVVCIDLSQSMERAIPDLQGQVLLLTRVLRLLPGEPRLGLVLYADSVLRARSLTADLDRIDERIVQARATRKGEHTEAVYEALKRAVSHRMGWRSDAVRRVLLVGDGPPVARELAPAEDLLRGARRDRSVVVDFVSPGSRSLPQFRDLAKAGGGRYVLYGRVDKVVPALLTNTIGAGAWNALEPHWRQFLCVLAED